MELIIAELSRYIIVILFALYTFYSYRAFIGRAAGNNEGVFRAQRVLIVMLHLACSAVILVEEKEIKYVVLWALELFFFLFFTKIYQVFYRGMSKLIWNNMMICMMIGFIMLGRLSYDYAIRQLVMASLALGVCLLVPLFIERFTIWEKIGWQYALAGVLLLLLVFVIGVEKYGARNWISIGGFELQPSEFVKIIYVFFIASLLAKRTDFKSVAIHVLLGFMQVLARQVLLHHILIQPCHDNRDEDAAEKLLEEVLFAVPVVKNKDTAVFIFPDGMYQSRKIQIQLAGNLIKY